MDDLSIKWTKRWREFINAELISDNKLKYLVLFDPEFQDFLKNFEFHQAYWSKPFNRMDPSFALELTYKKAEETKLIELRGRITETNLFFPVNTEKFEKVLQIDIGQDALFEFGHLLKEFNVIQLIDELHVNPINNILFL